MRSPNILDRETEWNIAYRRVRRLHRHLCPESREPSETLTRAIGIVILANRAAYRGRAPCFPEHVVAAGVGGVTLVRAGVRVRPGLVRAVEGLDVSWPMDDSHRLPYLAGRRGVVIVFLGLAAPLVDDLSASRYGHLLLRHDGRLYAQGCLETYRGPLQAFRVTRYRGGSLLGNLDRLDPVAFQILRLIFRGRFAGTSDGDSELRHSGNTHRNSGRVFSQRKSQNQAAVLKFLV